MFTSLSDKAQKIIKIVLIIVLSILILVVAFKAYRAFKKPVNAKYVAGGGTLPSGWTPTAITDNLYNVIAGIFTFTGAKDDAYKAFNSLNDNQMIAVYNDWLKRYSDKKSYLFFPMGTLTQALKDETGYVSIGGENNADIMKSNLDRLKLS